VTRTVTVPMTDLPMDVRPKGVDKMLLNESLARERMREAERVAREHRLSRRLSSAKRWGRISEWAARRAARAEDLL
jgi:hypothetical protein